MAANDLLQSKTKDEVGKAIRDIEAKTAAEVVVAVRASSGHYRHTDYLVGFVLSLVGLCVFIFHPAPFDEDLFPLESLLAFAVGAFVSANVAPLRRALTSPALRAENVRRAARATFVELGVSRTRGRTGLLVYVSTFERKVELVADHGLDPAEFGELLETARKDLEAAVAASGALPQFLSALVVLGEALGERLPRASDDENELPDEVHA
jgi:putative membrane protein